MVHEADAAKSIKIAIGAASVSFLFLITALCMVLRPEMFDHPHWGLSYFGSQRITVVPYYLGFAVVIASLAWITKLLWSIKGEWQWLRLLFLTSTILATCIAVTSPMQGAFLYWSHIYLCFVLLLVLVAADIRILWRPGRGWPDYGASAILTAGVVVALLSSNWLDVLGIYYWGEVILFVGGFACLGRAALRAVSGNS